MRIVLRRIIVAAGVLGGIGGLMPNADFMVKLQGQDRTSFRPALARAIAAAEKNNLFDLRGKFRQKLDDDFNIYDCDVFLPGSAGCAVYLYDGVEALKNFVVWDYGEGKTREAAEQLFVELVNGVTRGMPSDWVGHETPKSNLGTRKLREFMASAKSYSGALGGPIITITATRRAELFEVKVELNAHHAD